MIQPKPNATSGTIPYEQRLKADRMWALREGSMHFEKESAVYETLLRIAHKLDELQVPYAIAGGMALFLHGYERFTQDVDIVVTRDGLRRIHEALEGLGYVPPFAGSKNLRDTQTGVRIEFLIEGGFPGDGKPKPVAFPNPADARVALNGIACVNLERLIEMKLASGMAAHRVKDLGDVQELIRALSLPADFKSRLNPYVQPLFQQLWDGVKNAPAGPDEQ